MNSPAFYGFYETQSQFLDILAQLANQPIIDHPQDYALQVKNLMVKNQQHWTLLGAPLRHDLTLISQKLKAHPLTKSIEQLASFLLSIANSPLNAEETWDKVAKLIEDKAPLEQVQKAFIAFEKTIQEGSDVAHGYILLNAVYGSFFLQEYKKAQTYLDLAATHLFIKRDFEFDRSFSLVVAATQIVIELFIFLNPLLIEEEIEIYRTAFLHHDFISLIRFFPEVFFNYTINWDILLTEDPALFNQTADQMIWKQLPVILDKKNVYRKVKNDNDRVITQYLFKNVLKNLLEWFVVQEEQLELDLAKPIKEEVKKKSDKDLLKIQFYFEIVLFTMKSLKEIFVHSSEDHSAFLNKKIQIAASWQHKIKEERKARELKNLVEEFDEKTSTSSAKKKRRRKNKQKDSPSSEVLPSISSPVHSSLDLPFLGQSADLNSVQEDVLKSETAIDAIIIPSEEISSSSSVPEENVIKHPSQKKKKKRNPIKSQQATTHIQKPIKDPIVELATEEKITAQPSTQIESVLEVKIEPSQTTPADDLQQRLLSRLQLPPSILQFSHSFEENTLFLAGATIPKLYQQKTPSVYHFVSFCSEEKILQLYPEGVKEGKKECLRIRLMLNGVQIHIQLLPSKPGVHYTIKLRESHSHLFYKANAIFVKILPHGNEVIDVFDSLTNLEAGELEFLNPNAKEIFFNHPLKYLQAHLLAAQLGLAFSSRVQAEVNRAQNSMSILLEGVDRENLRLAYDDLIDTLGKDQAHVFSQNQGLQFMI